MKTLATLCLAMSACLTAVADGTLTTVAEAKRVALESLTSPMEFDFTVSLLRQSGNVLMIADDTGGTYASTRTNPPSNLQPWDVLRVKGRMCADDVDKSRLFAIRDIKVIKHGSPIPPTAVTAQEINTGQKDFKPMRIRGVIASCIRDEVAPDFLWASLRTDSGRCLVSMNATALGTRTARELADAEVEIAGLPVPIAGLRRNLGRCLSVFSPADIALLKPPPRKPLDAPPLSETAGTTHRQHISGDVAAVSSKHFFLQTVIGRIIKVVPASGERMPRTGERVDVAGFLEYVPYWPCLSDAVVSASGMSTKPPEKAKPVSISALFNDASGRRRLRTQQNGHRLALQGKVVSATENELEISDEANSIFIMIDAIRDQLPEIPEPGSLLEATGLCWAEFHNKYESDIYPTFLRFTLYPYDAADIRVLASPPWWTPFRLMVLVLVLVALLAVSFAWNVAVNRKAERRGRELYEERASHAIAEKKVEERTRLAVELHDSISQTLTGIAMQLEVGNNATAQTMLTACRSDLRRCLWDLRSRTFEEKNMTEAIERTLEPHSVGAKISVRFNVPRESLSDSTTHAILHIVRELVVNAIRHGRATEIKVAGECHEGTISFSVKDNGCGFDPSAASGPDEGHFGLLGIRERLKAIHGTFSVESAPGKGAKFKVTILNPGK